MVSGNTAQPSEGNHGLGSLSGLSSLLFGPWRCLMSSGGASNGRGNKGRRIECKMEKGFTE